MEFSMKDMYRASIEHASGGRNTIMYDDYGCPNEMVCIPKFDVSMLGESEFGSGIHPAFNIDGKEVNEVWIGKYAASDMGGVPVSMRRRSIISTLHTQQAQDLTRKKGKGWHILTNTEWAAMVLPIWRRGIIPHGNISATDREPRYPNEIGGERDMMAKTGTDAIDFILTGSGPDTYSHDETPFGVFDLFGNAWELTTGINIHGNGAFLYTGEADGTPVNRPFIKNVDVKDHDFRKASGIETYFDGWHFSDIHFCDGSKLGSGQLTPSKSNANFVVQSDISNRMDSLATKYVKILKQLCIVPPDDCKNDGFGCQVYCEAKYKSIQRGCRNRDGDAFWKGRGRLFAFDNLHINCDISGGSCYDFRVCWVDA